MTAARVSGLILTNSGRLRHSANLEQNVELFSTQVDNLALEVSHFMCYIKSRLTYLLTYLAAELEHDIYSVSQLPAVFWDFSKTFENF